MLFARGAVRLGRLGRDRVVADGELKSEVNGVRNGGFHRYDYPKGWFIMENPNVEWMIWGHFSSKRVDQA